MFSLMIDVVGGFVFAGLLEELVDGLVNYRI